MRNETQGFPLTRRKEIKAYHATAALIAFTTLAFILVGTFSYYAGVKQGHHDYKDAPDGKCILYSLPNDGLTLDS